MAGRGCDAGTLPPSGRIGYSDDMKDLAEHIDRLVRAEHWDPFVLLGPHPAPAQGKPATVIRAFLPDAAQVTVLTEEPEQLSSSMKRVHRDGLFEAVIPSTLEKLRY